jgi:ParB family chromosome partitioning protein
MDKKRPALGRGLSALIPDLPAPAAAAHAPAPERAFDVDTDRLRPNAFQPRSTWDDSRLDALAQSIRSNGMIQPIVVRRAGDGFEIVAGERRWRASQRAGLLKVPVVVRDIPDDRLLAAALIENIQREDLNAIEEAQAYRRLIDELHLTQEQIAESVGKDRSSIANYLRLLKLPHEVRESIASGALSMGHARALAAITDEAQLLRLARDVIAKQFSVRDTEALIRKATAPPSAPAEPEKDVHTRAAEERLRFALGTRVRIVRKGKAGRIEIDFTSEDELQRLYEALTG